MDESLIATPGWAGHERRTAERRVSATFPADERRTRGERRSNIALTQPAEPTLGLHGSQAIHDEGGMRPETWEASRSGPSEHDAIPSVATIGGHPIHPILVPLPIGALALTVVSDLAFARTRDRFFARASRALTAAGIATGLGAAAFGALDFLGRDRVRDHPEAWIHAGGNVAAVGLSALSLVLRMRDRDAAPPAAMALSGVVGTLLLVTGWLGGELSYRHRVGVTRDPGGAH
jgi:uncharacterized membrane protein